MAIGRTLVGMLMAGIAAGALALGAGGASAQDAAVSVAVEGAPPPILAPDPGTGTYDGEPGLSRSSAYSLAYPPRGVTYPPIDAYGASGAPGPNYVLPPREVSVSVRPLIYNGYQSSEYAEDVVATPALRGPREGYGSSRYDARRFDGGEGRVRHATRHRRIHHVGYGRIHVGSSFAPYAVDRDDLPAPTRLVKRCVANDWGRQDCQTSVY